jgi:hypothetical protein
MYTYVRIYGMCTYIFVANSFISPFNTQIVRIKPFNTQRHCYVLPENLIPSRGLNPGLLVPEADAMSSASLRQGWLVYLTNNTGTILIPLCWLEPKNLPM